MEFQVEPNESTILHVSLGTSYTGLFPQTELYEIDDLTTPTETLDLLEQGLGVYYYKWTAGSARTKYLGITKVYSGSYGGTLSPIDVPVPFTINVGRYSTGGVFGGSSGGRVVRTKLTDEEIQKIVQAVMQELTPILEKKSEFDPNIDLVRTNLNPIIEAISNINFDDSGVRNQIDEKVNSIVETIKNYTKIYDDSQVRSMIVGLIEESKLNKKQLDAVVNGISEIDSKATTISKISGKVNKIYACLNFLESNDFRSFMSMLKIMNENEKKRLLDIIGKDRLLLNKLSLLSKAKRWSKKY